MKELNYTIGDTIIRHGDVHLKKWDNPCSNNIPTATQALLHKGENHHHRLNGGSFKIEEKDGNKYLEVVKETKLEHEEHNTISITPGFYLIDIQVEYDHWLEESRRVID